MMLEAFAADEAQQLLQVGNLGNARAAEGLERIVGEAARACKAADDAVVVVGGIASITHYAGLDAAHAGSEGVLNAHGAGDDRLIVHRRRLGEEVRSEE